MGTAACPSTPPPSPVSPAALRALLTDRFWSYEDLRPATPAAAPSVDRLAIWFGSDGTYENWYAIDFSQRGRWSVVGDGLVELDDDIDPTNQLLSVTPLGPEDGVDGVYMGAANGLGFAMHEFRASDECPAMLARFDSRLIVDAVATDPQKDFVTAGQAAVALDAQGDVHMLTTVSYADESPTSYYATSVGARCGVRTYAFDAQSGGKLAVDDEGGLHAAYASGTLRYAWRPAQAPASTPWQTVEFGAVGEYGVQLSFAVKPDGGVAIVAARDFGYRVLKSDTPLDAASWVVSTLPVERAPGALLNFAASAAFDSTGRLYVAASDGGGGPVLVFRDDDDAWTPLLMESPPRSGIEGPQGFAFDGDDRLYFVTGDLGITAGNNFPARAGDLLLGTALLDGAAGGAPDGALDEPAWRVVGAGGRASLAIDPQGRVQIYSSSRLTGGWHTIVPPGALDRDDASSVIERYGVTPSLDPYDWPTIAVGREGDAIFGHGVAFSLLPRGGRLAPLFTTAPIRIDSDIGGARVVFPDLDVTCTESCDLPVPAGAWLQWRVERGPRDPVATTIFGNGIASPELNPGGGGTSGIPVGFGTCEGCDVVAFTFAPPELLAHVLPRPDDWVAGTLVGPVTASAAGIPAIVDVVQDSQHGALLQRFTASLAPLAPLALPGWSTITDVSWDSRTLVVLTGTTTAQTAVGGVSGFGGEAVVVGVHVDPDDATPPSVAWVWPDDEGPAGALPGAPRRISSGTAVVIGESLVVIDDDGALVRRTALPGTAGLVEPAVVVVDGAVHVLGGVGESVNEAWARTRWIVVDGAGAIAADRELDGVVLAAQATVPPAPPGIVVAFGLTTNQPWDGDFVLQTSLAGATLSPAGVVRALGTPVTLPPEAGSGTAALFSIAGAPSTLRGDGGVDVALTFFTGATTIARVDDDGLALVAGYGNPRTNVTARYEVRASGVATLGDSLVLGAQASGTLPFNSGDVVLPGPVPVLLELP